MSNLPKIAVGFCPVGFCPVGFCPSGVLSQWGFVRLPFNDTVCMEFQICFTIEKYANNIFSLCETSKEFIHAFCLSEIHFHQSGPLRLIKTMLKSFRFCMFFSCMELLSKGSYMTGATK